MPDQTQPAWITAGLQDLGFHEDGNNQGIEGFIAQAHCGSVGDPWCAIWANAKFEQSGIRRTRSASSQSFRHDQGFVKLDGPALGDAPPEWPEPPDPPLPEPALAAAVCSWSTSLSSVVIAVPRSLT